MMADALYNKLYDLTQERGGAVEVLLDPGKCIEIEDVVYDEELGAVVIIPKDNS